MTKRIKVSASILSSDFGHLADEIKKCESAGVDLIHVDVMDGQFVPPITIGSLIVRTIRLLTKLPIDVHLMIESPWRQIDDFIAAGSDIIAIHAECYGKRRSHCLQDGQFPKEVDSIDVNRARQDILKIKQAGKKAMMVLNPGTPDCLKDLVNDLDGVLVMSVNPGFSGQKFMPEVLPKMKALRQRFLGDIFIDGGINDKNADSVKASGANVLITASYLFNANDMRLAVQNLKR